MSAKKPSNLKTVLDCIEPAKHSLHDYLDEDDGKFIFNLRPDISEFKILLVFEFIKKSKDFDLYESHVLYEKAFSIISILEKNNVLLRRKIQEAENEISLLLEMSV